jgi:CRP/FNR family transcriptional regulator, cyclic AMP receptor protein
MALNAIKHVELLPAKSILFDEGFPADGIYVLCTGKVRLSMCSPGGQKLTIRIASPGEVLGLSACLTGGLHQVTAEVLEDTQVAVVAREDFLPFLHEHTDACAQVLYFLSDDLRVAYDQVRAIDHSHPTRWAKQQHAS